jgi:hypothetical protein
MKLPSDITFELPIGSKDAVLVFEDEAKAIKWEENMILWEQTANHEGKKRRISRLLTVGSLSKKLGLPQPAFDGREVFMANGSGYQGLYQGIYDSRGLANFVLGARIRCGRNSREDPE